MAATPAPLARRDEVAPARLSRRALRPCLIALGAYSLVLGAWMAFAPGSFYDQVAPFGGRNTHFLHDLATYQAALGASLLIAAWRPGWRVPVLTFATIEFALHAVSHLADINGTHPHWKGVFDFVAVTLLALLPAWLLRVAVRERHEPAAVAPVRAPAAPPPVAAGRGPARR